MKKAGSHTALADIHESIAELRHYRDHFCAAWTERTASPCGSEPGSPRPRRRASRHRRWLIVLTLLSVFFSVLGYFTNPVSLPGMCRIYG